MKSIDFREWIPPEEIPVLVFWKKQNRITPAIVDSLTPIETIAYKIIEICTTWKEAKGKAADMDKGLQGRVGQ